MATSKSHMQPQGIMLEVSRRPFTIQQVQAGCQDPERRDCPLHGSNGFSEWHGILFSALWDIPIDLKQVCCLLEMGLYLRNEVP